MALVLAAAASIRGSRFRAYGRGFAVLVLLDGLLVKPIFVALGLPSDEFIAEFILAPLSTSEYWAGSVLLLGCYALFIGAMIFTSLLLRHVRRDPIPQHGVCFLLGRSWAVMAIGMLGLIVFFSQNPELLTGASKNILATDDLAGYSGSGGLRLLISILYFIPFLMLVNISAGYKVRGSLQLMWTSAFAWVAFGFFSDQRGAILFSVFSWLIAYRSFIGKIGIKHLVVAAGLALSMVFVRTVLRLTTDDGGLLALADEIVGNYIGRNLVENAKTLIIMRSIPEQLAYSYGGSYLDSLLILIPRSLFAAKQTVNLDTVIGMSVFGCEVFGACGVPPGLIAESYLNFGIVGLPVMLLLCGSLTAWLDWKAASGTILFRVFYAASFVYFGLAVLGSSISSFATQAVMDAFVLLFAYFTLGRSMWAPADSAQVPVKPYREILGSSGH